MSYQELPTYDQMADSDDLWNAQGLEVCEFFLVPPTHVMGVKRVTLKGLPPAEWSI